MWDQSQNQSSHRSPADVMRRPLRLVAAALIIGVIAASCSFSKAQVPAPDSATPPPAGVPLSDQDNVSPYPLLERLGRWNGTTFAPVTAGSISGGHVIVMTHGWAVGFLDTYEALQAKSPTLVDMWDPGMADPKTGELLADNFITLATSLQAADPTAAILFYSWVDQSATNLSAFAAYAPERATEINGHRMATAIDQVLTDGFTANDGQVHLIGHSFGANVATTAALALTESPRQLTLFDSPEVDIARFGGAKNDLRYKLTRLDIGREEGETFVDNYVSEVGEAYHGYPGLGQIVDVRLAPPTSDNGGEKHEFPIGWYAGTTIASSTVGYRWSPLAGGNDSGLGSLYEQTSPTTPLELAQIEGPPISNVGSEVAYDTTPLTIASNGGTGGGVTFRSGSPDVVNVDFATDQDSLWLTFDLSVSGPSTDAVHLFVDGRERSMMSMPSAGTGADGRFVILYDVSPGSHVLSVALEGSGAQVGSPTGVVGIDALAIVSTADIDRNFTPAQTRRLVTWAIVIILIAIALFLALVIWVVVQVVRSVMHRRRERSVTSH